LEMVLPLTSPVASVSYQTPTEKLAIGPGRRWCCRSRPGSRESHT
jgi:hypothetical protein